jgi:signal transduction histidine kinase
MDFNNMAGQNQSFGLFSLSERLNYFKGNLAIQSAPGCGARVTLTAPLLIRLEEKGGAA